MAEDSTERSDLPPHMTERRFAQNVRAARESAGISQVALAERMQEYGYPWHQQTVARTENGSRPIRLGEAFALTRALGGGADYSLDALVRPRGLAREAWALLGAMRRARSATRKLRQDSVSLQRGQEMAMADLDRVIRRVVDSGLESELAEELALARRALSDGRGEGPSS